MSSLLKGWRPTLLPSGEIHTIYKLRPCSSEICFMEMCVLDQILHLTLNLFDLFFFLTKSLRKLYLSPSLKWY